MLQRIVIGLFVWAAVTATATAQDSTREHEILQMIQETADNICYTVQQEGQQNDKELSGKVQAQLNGVISKLVDLNGDVGAKLNTQQYHGLLQEQLASALKQSTDCRKEVFHTLVDRLLPPTSASPRQSPQSISHAPLSELTESAKGQQSVYVFASTNRPEDQDVADDLEAALKGKGYRVVNNVQEAALLVDVTGTSIGDRNRTVNGVFVYYGTARANIKATWAANSTPVFSDPTVEEIKQGDNPYDVREEARAAMIEAAARRFKILSEK